MARRRLSKRRLLLLAMAAVGVVVGARRGWVGSASGPFASSRAVVFPDVDVGSRAALSDGRSDANPVGRGGVREAALDRALDASPPASPVSHADAAAVSPPPPSSRVAGNPSLEVDESTHEADPDAAAAIARAGSKTTGAAASLRRDRPVFATFVSAGFHEFMLNWHAHATRLGVDNVIVAAFDEETETLCRERGIPYHGDADLRYTFDVMATGGQPLHDAGAKVTMEGKAFQQIGALKAAFLLHLLRAGHEIVVSDVDTAWLRDPREWFANDLLPRRADVALSTDCLSRKDERAAGGCWNAQFNTGVMWLRPTNPTKTLMEQWRDALLTTDHKFEHDQDILNRLLREETDGRRPGFRPVADDADAVNSASASVVGDGPQLSRAARGITLGALPMSLFAGGHVYFVQRLHERLGVDPLVVHTTYQFSQARGKRQRLRERGLWLLDDAAYYGREGAKFVAMRPEDQPPAALVSTAGVENHLAAAAWYRLAIRNLFAVARVTGRVPILPKITCACDRYWGDVLPGCAIPGADVKPPFDECPQDHIMNIPNLERAGLDWREWSFLTNPAADPGLLRRDQRAYVALTLDANASDSRTKKVMGASFEEATRRAKARGDVGFGRAIEVSAFPTDAEIRDAVGRADEKLVTVSSGAGTFCGFESHADARAFDEAMAIGLQAESHFCGAGAGGGRSCEVGFDVPKGTATDRDCAAMRKRGGDEDAEDAFRERYERIGRHVDSM